MLINNNPLPPNIPSFICKYTYKRWNILLILNSFLKKRISLFLNSNAWYFLCMLRTLLTLTFWTDYYIYLFKNMYDDTDAGLGSERGLSGGGGP